MPVFRTNDRRYHVLYDAHAWVGVVAGLILYLMFVTGIVALFWQPVSAWEEPAHHSAPAGDVDQWWSDLAARAPHESARVSLGLPAPDEGRLAPTGNISSKDRERSRWIWDDGQWREPNNHAGLFLFRIHFLFHEAVPILYTFAGLISLAMMFAIFTGLGIHLRKVIPEMHRFRPHLRQRGVWSDLHKVTAVAGLPFQLMIAYTGALIVLAPLAIAAVGTPLYRGDFERVKAVALGTEAPVIEADEEAAPQAPASTWIHSATNAVPGMKPSSLRTKAPGLATTVIQVSGHVEDAPGRVTVYVAGTSGEVLEVRDRSQDTAPAAAQRWLLSLHFAELGGWGLKLVYALLAALSAATMLTGIGLWLARRRSRGAGRGDRFLTRLTTGVGAGVPLAAAMTLAMSRALPWDLSHRIAVIELSFVFTLAAAIAYCSVDAQSRRAWARLLCAAALTFGSLPLLQSLRTGAGLLGAQHPTVVTVVDLGLLVVAAMIAAAAWVVARGPHRLEKPARGSS